jgi:hypothetical protein
MNTIVPGLPRTEVQATFPDGRIFEAPLGTPVAEILRAAYGSPDVPMVAAIVNGRLRELTWRLLHDSDVTPLSAGSTDGARIYRRSVVFLMVAATADVFPNAEVYIEHSATTTGAYFCETREREPFTQADLDAIERRMREIVAEDVPITRAAVPVAEAVALFRGRPSRTANVRAVLAEGPARLLSGLHGAVHRLSALLRAANHAAGFHAAISASAEPHPRYADHALPEAVRRVRAGWPLARPAGHPRCWRAERLDCRRPVA